MRHFLIYGALFITLTFTACGNKATTTQDNSIPSVSESNEVASKGADENSSVMNSEEDAQQEYIIISLDELKSCYKKIEITQDNWQNYFELTEYKRMEKDSFGDETGAYKIYSTVLPLKDKTILVNSSDNGLDGVAFEFHTVYKDGSTSKVMDEMHVIKLYYYFLEKNEGNLPYASLNIIQLSAQAADGKAYQNELQECTLTRVKGTVTEFYAPSADKWNTDEDGNKFLVVNANGTLYALFDDGATFLISSIIHDTPTRKGAIWGSTGQGDWGNGLYGPFGWKPILRRLVELY